MQCSVHCIGMNFKRLCEYVIMLSVILCICVMLGMLRILMAFNSLFRVFVDQWHIYVSEVYWLMRMFLSSRLKVFNDVHCFKYVGKEFQISGPLCFIDF